MGPACEQAAVIVTTTFETMGLLVYKKIARFDLVMELAGGMMMSMHRKLSVWLENRSGPGRINRHGRFASNGSRKWPLNTKRTGTLHTNEPQDGSYNPGAGP